MTIDKSAIPFRLCLLRSPGLRLALCGDRSGVRDDARIGDFDKRLELLVSSPKIELSLSFVKANKSSRDCGNCLFSFHSVKRKIFFPVSSDLVDSSGLKLNWFVLSIFSSVEVGVHIERVSLVTDLVERGDVKMGDWSRGCDTLTFSLESAMSSAS